MIANHPVILLTFICIALVLKFQWKQFIDNEFKNKNKKLVG